jgi:hypothetical protein
MAKRRVSSRLQKIEDRRNKQQAILFVLLSIGFILLIFFVGIPMLIRAAVFLGDVRSSGQSIEKNDSIPPIPPRLLEQFEATSSADLSVSGFAEPDSTVRITVNETEQGETITASDGMFIFDGLQLDEGENSISAISSDAAGNISNPSRTLFITYDDQAPSLTITSPEDGATFYDTDRQVIVAGETDEDARVRVKGFIAEVDTEGNFAKPLQLVEGENEIIVTARDDAGNTTSASIKVSYSR